jgi:hypothetical protein
VSGAVEDVQLPGTETPPAAKAEPAPKRTRADRAPSTRARKGGRPANVKGAALNERELQTSLEDAFVTIGMSVMALAPSPEWEADGVAIIERSPKLADSLVRLAKQNPAVARVLTAGVSGSAWLGVIGAFGGLGFAIARNHGALGALAGLDGPGGGGTMEEMAAKLYEQMSPEQQAEMAEQAAQMFTAANGAAPTAPAGDAGP